MNSSKSIYKRHRFPPEIIQHTVWLYHRFNLSHRDIEDLLAKRSGVLQCAMKQYASGATNLDRNMLDVWEENIKDMEIHFSLMKCSWRYKGSSIIYGEPLIKTVRSSMYFCRNGVMERLQSASLGGYWRNTGSNPEWSSLINWEVRVWLTENWYLTRFTIHRSMRIIV